MYFVTTGGLDHWVTGSELHNNKDSSSPWPTSALSDKIQLLTPALIYVMNTMAERSLNAKPQQPIL